MVHPGVVCVRCWCRTSGVKAGDNELEWSFGSFPVPGVAGPDILAGVFPLEAVDVVFPSTNRPSSTLVPSFNNGDGVS
jgi:hypothetical protein